MKTLYSSGLILSLCSGCQRTPSSERVVLSARTVQVGAYEDLLDVACRTQCSVQDLIHENGVSACSVLQPGQILVLPVLRHPPSSVQTQDYSAKIPAHPKESFVFPVADTVKDGLVPVLSVAHTSGPAPVPSVARTAHAVAVLKNLSDIEFCAPFALDVLYSATRGSPHEGYWVNILKAPPSGRVLVCAMKAGKVIYTGSQIPALTQLILIKHGDGSVTTYGCLKKVLVKKGVWVDARQVVGEGSSNPTGNRQFYFERRHKKTLQELIFFKKHLT